jgi:ubiquinone/menaquinone biosynthesis C-methylase UbiE
MKSGGESWHWPTFKVDDKVLDVATGTGSIAISLANRVDNKCQTTGIDITAAMLGKARDNIKEFGLEKVIELMKALAEMVRVLRPGRRLAIGEILPT